MRASIVVVLALLNVVVLLLVDCASAPTSRLKTQDVVVQLIQFHGAVAEQYEQGGMELEHYNLVQRWIASEIRVLQANPRQWEGQARLDWPRVKSICVPFDTLAPWTRTIDRLLQ